MHALVVSGILDLATHATGIAPKIDEDIMVARTTSWPDNTEAADTVECEAIEESYTNGILNVHHDQHKGDDRMVTFMVYLTTLDGSAEQGGDDVCALI